MVAPGDSGLPGSLQEVLTGPHPAVLGPLPARRQQRLARLAEEGCWVPTHWWGFHLPSGRYCSGPACDYRRTPGGPIAQVQTEDVHHGLHHYPKGTDLAEAEDLGGHRAQRLGVS